MKYVLKRRICSFNQENSMLQEERFGHDLLKIHRLGEVKFPRDAITGWGLNLQIDRLEIVRLLKKTKLFLWFETTMHRKTSRTLWAWLEWKGQKWAVLRLPRVSLFKRFLKHYSLDSLSYNESEQMKWMWLNKLLMRMSLINRGPKQIPLVQSDH